MILAKRAQARNPRGIATVELAVILPFLLILLLGVWEIGRLIQVQQVMSNSAREAARLAGQSVIIDLNDNPKEITQADLENTVRNYLREAGVDTTNLVVTFEFLNGDTNLTQPHQSVKSQRFRVTASIPFNDVRWILLGFTDIQTITAVVEWESLVDDPFQLQPDLPTWDSFE